jgi:hypothetical protein
MTEATPATVQRSYGCTFGCGNPYDFIVIDVADGTTQFLCLPDYVRLAVDMVAAVSNPTDPKVIAAMAGNVAPESVPMRGRGPASRGRNAPVTADDDDLIEAYTGVITEDELPDEFR